MATKEVREKVVAFRVTEDQWNVLTSKITSAKITGAPSPGLMARKLMIDWQEDALTWRNKKRKSVAPEIFKANQAMASAA